MKSLGGPIGIISILALVVIINSFLIFSPTISDRNSLGSYGLFDGWGGEQSPSGGIIATGINPTLLLYGVGVLGFFLLFIAYMILSKRYKFGRITKKVIVIVLSFSLIPIAIIGIINIQTLMQSEGETLNIIEAHLKDNSENMVLGDLDQLAEVIESNYDDMSLRFSIISQSPLLANNLEEANLSKRLNGSAVYSNNRSESWNDLQDYFMNIHSASENQINQIHLFYKDMSIVNSLYPNQNNNDTQKETGYWFPRAMGLCLQTNPPQTYISPLRTSTETNDMFISCAKGIKVGDECLGALKVDFIEQQIVDSIKRYSYGTSGYAMLVDYDYKTASGKTLSWPVILSRSIEGGTYQISENRYDESPYKEKYLVYDKAFLNKTQVGSDSVVAYKKVNIPGKQWYVFIIVPKSEFIGLPAGVYDALSEIYQNNIYLFILSIIGTFSAIIIAGFFISEQLTKPIIELGVISKEIESGNFAARTVVESKDEIGDLAKTLNRTLETLDKTDRERKRIDHMKTEFISITSHELRSPMTPMRAQLQMLIKGYFGKLSKKQQDSLDIVLRNTERLDNIIKDFLEISRIEAARLKFNFVSTNLKPHIQRLIREMNNFMPEKNIKIEVKIGDLPEMEVDPDRVMQVLRNLTNNAIKFTPEQGMISISVEAQDTGLLFTVKDSGIGISRKDQIRIFEPFFQAEESMYRQYGGTGLGLAICKGIIESQNGSIWLESEPGRGTTFYFTVPYVPVKEIKPIKVLFSTKSELEGRVEDLFTEILGPMGKRELESLKIENKLDEKGFREYVKVLQKMGVLNKERAEIFKNNILNTIQGKQIQPPHLKTKPKGTSISEEMKKNNARIDDNKDSKKLKTKKKRTNKK